LQETDAPRRQSGGERPDTHTQEKNMLDYDKLATQLGRWRESEASRASDAGEMRQEIGVFIEDHGLNKKGLSWVRALDKMPKEKRDDVLATFDSLRETMQPGWDGQKVLDFDAPIEPVNHPFEDAAA
jgi:hypothetical protein